MRVHDERPKQIEWVEIAFVYHAPDGALWGPERQSLLDPFADAGAFIQLRGASNNDQRRGDDLLGPRLVTKEQNKIQDAQGV